MATERKDPTPYILDKAAGALMEYRGLDRESAYACATMVLQAVGLMRPGSFELTRIGKDVERRLKIRRALLKKVRKK